MLRARTKKIIGCVRLKKKKEKDWNSLNSNNYFIKNYVRVSVTSAASKKGTSDDFLSVTRLWNMYLSVHNFELRESM